MADEKNELDADQPQAETPKKGGKKILFLIIGSIILLVTAAGGFFGYKKYFGKNEAGGNTVKQETASAKNILVAIDPFVLNLAEQGRFLKMSLQFDLIEESQRPTVENKIPQLRDAIITLVSSKSAESLASPEGKFQLKDELLLRANQAVGKEVFKNLYFTEFVMQ